MTVKSSNEGMGSAPRSAARLTRGAVTCNVVGRVARSGAMDDALRRALEADIQMTHERFCAAMEVRLPTIEGDSLERYFAVLSKLVAKLEDTEKHLSQVLGEMLAEAAPLVMAEMQSRRS